MQISTNTWLFQNATTTGNGNIFKSGRNDQITIYITGDSTSRTILFEGCDAESTPNWFPIPAVKLSDLTSATSTTGNNEVWVIDMAQWVGVRCRISAIAGGTVKITGRVVEVGNSLIKNKDVQIIGNKSGKQASDTITRPNDTTAYSTGDVVSTGAGEILEFANLGASGDMIAIISSNLMVNINAVPSGCLGFRLHLYNASPTVIADNTAFNLPSADRAKYLGFINICLPKDIGDTIYAEDDGKVLYCKLTGSSIYGILTTLGTETPTAESIYTLTINTMGV